MVMVRREGGRPQPKPEPVMRGSHARMFSVVITAVGGGLALVVAAIVLVMILTRRCRLDAASEADASMTAERAKALRTVQEKIERGSRSL
jgi:hypothetical protein